MTVHRYLRPGKFPADFRQRHAAADEDRNVRPLGTMGTELLDITYDLFILDHAKEAQVYNLTMNYRSGQDILNTANRIISHS